LGSEASVGFGLPAHLRRADSLNNPLFMQDALDCGRSVGAVWELVVLYSILECCGPARMKTVKKEFQMVQKCALRHGCGFVDLSE
jgi:hypothetical protein